MLLRHAQSTTKLPPMPMDGNNSIFRGLSAPGRFSSGPFRLSFRRCLGLPSQDRSSVGHLFFNGALHFVNLARDLISFSGLGFILWPPLTKFAFHSARRSVLRLHRAPEIAGSEHLALREPV